MTKTVYTTDDYDDISWHDNIIHSISLIDEDFENDLILGIDFITKWICEDNKCQFMIAPANLVFHNVEDIELNIKKPGLQQNGYLGLTIDDIIKKPFSNKTSNIMQWIFNFTGNSNEGINKLTFKSSGFTQTLLKEPILKDEQTLIASERI